MDHERHPTEAEQYGSLPLRKNASGNSHADQLANLAHTPIAVFILALATCCIPSQFSSGPYLEIVANLAPLEKFFVNFAHIQRSIQNMMANTTRSHIEEVFHDFDEICFGAVILSPFLSRLSDADLPVAP